jgi:RIO kinase 1
VVGSIQREHLIQRRLAINSRAIPPSLQELMDDEVIDAVVCSLKSGKEADLFVVERHPYHYVAKVYKERRFRSFKNDAGYREGRKVRNTRSQRALEKNTRFGQKLAEEGWHMAEVNALRTLSAAGLRVPRVLAHHDRVLIMEMICDPQGQLAPQLAQVPLTAEGALEIYHTIVEQVVLMLLEGIVHGDLSPYNILYRDDGPVIIDMPQCVSAAHNQQAGKLLERDVKAVARHLGLINPEVKRLGREAWQIWEEYERGTLTAAFRPELGRERPKQVADIDDLVGFVKEANEEAELERRAAHGDENAQALLRAAERRMAKRARKAAQLKAAEEEARREEEEAKRKQERAARGGGDKKGRRGGGKREGGKREGGKREGGKRGRRGGGKRESDSKRDDAPAKDAGAKKRGRRRGERSRDAAPADGSSGSATPSFGGRSGGGGSTEGGPKKKRRRRRRRSGGSPQSAS